MGETRGGRRGATSVPPRDLHTKQPSAKAPAHPGNPETGQHARANETPEVDSGHVAPPISGTCLLFPPYANGSQVRRHTPTIGFGSDTPQQRTGDVIVGDANTSAGGDAAPDLDHPAARARDDAKLVRARDKRRCGTGRWLSNRQSGRVLSL